MPDVSVIVPAYNAAGTLPATLAALARQRFDGEAEIVVVDNAATDDTGAIAAASGVRVVRLAVNRGPAGARNAGVEATSAPLIAFTDADCEPEPDWLRHGVAALRTGAELVQGPILPVHTPRTPFDRTLRVEGPSPLYETANLFITRAAFVRAGGFAGFDPVAHDAPPFGEDTLFAWAARRAGARPGYAPDALVRHAVFPRGPRGLLRERRRLRFFPGLVREVPELRGELRGGIFLTRRSAAFDAALVGAVTALAARRVLPLAAVAPYAWLARPRSAVRRSALREAAALVAADAVGAVALVRGSVAARTPVL